MARFLVVPIYDHTSDAEANELAEDLLRTFGLAHEPYLCEAAELPKEKAQKVDVRSIGIEELDLSVRAYNCCKRKGVDTIGDLLDLSIAEINSWIAPSAAYGREGATLGLVAFRQLAEAQDYARSLV